MAEQWRPVLGFEGFYEVSDLGRVYSIPRIDLQGRARGGRMLTVFICKATGYPKTGLRKDGKLTSIFIHALILEAFVSPRVDGQISLHGDGNRANSVLSNLSWGTYQDNADDRGVHGRHAKGIANGGGGKLTEDQVRDIRRRIAAGDAQTVIARDNGVTPGLICSIKKGRSWSHITWSL